jgi:LPS O-antigen subunit length determinant protein (WzzB/FepE family)
MAKNSKKNNDEINLIEMIYTLWVGRWKLAAALVISLIAVLTYQSTETKNFTAITEIKPIGTIKLNKFLMINTLIDNSNTNTNTNTNINNNGANTSEIDAIREKPDKKSPEISSSVLFNLYVDVLNDRKVFENAIREFNLLEASQYNNEQEYNEAIIRLASFIKILLPNPQKNFLETSYSTINFIYDDDEKWKSVLIYVDEFANKLVKKLLIEEYNNALSALKIEQKYRIEDISIKINNKLNDYNRETFDRLAYLAEQSAIAKELGIAKNTIEVQAFGSQNALLSNVKTDSPFYLRGYEAIDKEIELIRLRKDKKAFIVGLFELEKEKRAIEQDQTIERVKLALQSTVLSAHNEFSAASLNLAATKFEYKDNNKLTMIAMVIGLMAGIFYVLISNALQSYRVSEKN